MRALGFEVQTMPMIVTAVVLFIACPVLLVLGLKLAIHSLRDGRSMKRNKLYETAQVFYLAAILSPVLGVLAAVSGITILIAC
jgi:membrane-anchored protein YejM (alkaline phosphatase superfamily)